MNKQLHQFCVICCVLSSPLILLLLQTQETNALVNQILEVQPRMASSGGGKSNDEIVNELAESILYKIPDKLDIDKALPELFEVKSLLS